MKILTLLFALFATSFAVAQEGAVAFPANISHTAWTALLQKYVNAQGLIAYADWKANTADRQALDDYLAQFGKAATPPATGDDMAASAINAYNAFAIQWILSNYPTDSIQALPKSFSRAEHLVGGQKVSLDAIEHSTLRPTIGYRAHAALVCCARSCPPLQQTAYTASGLNGQIDAAYRAWLAREDLNQFLPDQKKIAISEIFKWFQTDFDKEGGVPKILALYAPETYRVFLTKGDFKTTYLPYNWGLNDQGKSGRSYNKFNLILDNLF